MICNLCPSPARVRGWCNKHYKRWRRTGDPLGSVVRFVSPDCPAGHRFTKANTVRDARGYRKCLACKRYWSRVYARRARTEGRAAVHRPGYWTEYKRAVRSGERVPKSRSKTQPKVTVTVVDLLSLDRGWWTAEGLALRLDLKTNSVYKALQRLEAKGQVVQRQLPRVEWKACVGNGN